jgi:opine dehydrogenase
MSIRKIAVLGAGNGGCAAAADLTLRGYETRLYSRSLSTIQPIVDKGGIELVEEGKETLARPALVTSDLKDAIAETDLVIIAVPAGAHASFAAKLAPLLRQEQMVLLNPGHTGGVLHFAHCLKQISPALAPRLCETVTLTCICRLKGPARVEIYRRTTHLRCAAFPGKFTGELVPLIQAIFPNVVPALNAMETGLCNINAIMHPAGMVANAGWIEKHSGDFCFYSEGITPAVANVIAKVDDERLKIVGKLGLPALTFVEIFYQAGLTTGYARASGSVYQAIHESVPNKTIKSPPCLDHRYFNEDVGYGLVPMSELGRYLKIETPVIDALILLASEMNQTDYRKQGLSLENMGLAGVNPSKLETVLQEGF